MAAPRTELALEQLACGGQAPGRGLRRGGGPAVAAREIVRGERPVRAAVPVREIAARIAHGGEERLGQAGRERDAEAVAVTARVLHRDVARLPRHGEGEDAPLGR